MRGPRIEDRFARLHDPRSPGTQEEKSLYSAPAVYRADVCGKVLKTDLCLVVELRPYMSTADFFIRILCPHGTGWINSIYFKEIASRHCE